MERKTEQIWLYYISFYFQEEREAASKQLIQLYNRNLNLNNFLNKRKTKMSATWEGSFNLLLGPGNNGVLESLVFITLHLHDLEPCLFFSIQIFWFAARTALVLAARRRGFPFTCDPDLDRSEVRYATWSRGVFCHQSKEHRRLIL